MKAKTVIFGIILIVIGICIYAYYDFYPDFKAKKLMTEARLVSERGDKTSINNAIDIYTKVIVDYSSSRYVNNAYYNIARCYENIGLERLAYLKYVYLIKNNRKLSGELRKEVILRLAHINVLKQSSEEAVSQLYALLNTNYDNKFRSRIYTELGHTYLRQKDYKKAKRMFDIALTESGSNQEALIGQARALKWMGKDDDAYDLYESFLRYFGAVSQYTNDVRKSFREQAYGSGINALRHGQYEAALSYFNRVLRNFPGDKISENALYWAGESYYAMGQFDNAILYFNKALTNGYYHKDEDSRIKKGYAYFVSKRFDLAAKEFQIYLQQYPKGKYAPVAANWKEMSTKELLFRIQTKKLPESKELEPAKQREEIEETPKKEEGLKEDELEEDTSPEKDEELSGDYYEDTLSGKRIQLDNVAEL